jgi:hypothetical protein
MEEPLSDPNKGGVAMSELLFVRGFHSLTLFDNLQSRVGTWEAYNNVDSHAHGIWPMGRYDFDYWVSHHGLGVDSAYGTHGIYVFKVPGRTGMGVHAGRKNVGKLKGPQHPTMGCIRTTEDAMAVIQSTHSGGDKLGSIMVTDVGDFPTPRRDVMWA